MNPYVYILNDFFPHPTSTTGHASAAVVLLRVMADAYTSGFSGNPYRYVLDQLAPYANGTDFGKWLAMTLNASAQG